METTTGQLRKRLSVEGGADPESGTANTFGEPDRTKSQEWLLWGSVEALSGREYWQASQAQVTISHRVVVRFSFRALSIGQDWRLSYEGHVLNVQVPPRDVDGRRKFLEILCLEKP